MKDKKFDPDKVVVVLKQGAKLSPRLARIMDRLQRFQGGRSVSIQCLDGGGETTEPRTGHLQLLRS